MFIQGGNALLNDPHTCVAGRERRNEPSILYTGSNVNNVQTLQVFIPTRSERE